MKEIRDEPTTYLVVRIPIIVPTGRPSTVMRKSMN